MAIKYMRKTAPSGRRILVRKNKKTSKPKCGLCHAVLLGVARGTPLEISKLGKSERRPSRPFGGVLCSKCAREVSVLKAVVKLKLKKKEDVPISLSGYI